MRIAKKSKKKNDIVKAVSLTDRAAKNGIMHRNKAARIKSLLSKLTKKKSISSKTLKNR